MDNVQKVIMSNTTRSYFPSLDIHTGDLNLNKFADCFLKVNSTDNRIYSLISVL